MKRKTILAYKSVQLKLASMFLMWFCVYAAASVALYFISYNFASERIESLGLADELKTKAMVIEQSERLALGYIGVTFLYMIFVFLYILAYSHRLTGPIFKMGRILDDCIEKKSWPQEVRFRKTDAFKDFADKFNSFIKVMKDR